MSKCSIGVAALLGALVLSAGGAGAQDAGEGLLHEIVDLDAGGETGCATTRAEGVRA